ncbi:MAG: hypothetical protein HY816_08555 [Candidatus Wallbacteria bacterium]|nr:hypothetical protein [Candidatus Wallbacteria bacterium]
MASEYKNVELTQLSSFERDAVGTFTAKLVEAFGNQISSVSLHGLKNSTYREAGVLELLVLLRKPSSLMEARVADLALDQYVESGINIRVTCFDQKQFKVFQKMKMPRIEQMQKDAVALWAA